MFCPNCGKNLPNDARFCDSCGSSLAPAASTTSANPEAPGAPAAPTYTAPAPQNTYNPNAYQAQPMPRYTPVNNDYELTRPLTMGNYIGMFLLMLIPIANLILVLVWAFGSNTNLNKRNWARAALLLGAIITVLYILFFAIFAASMGSVIRNFT